MLLAAALSERAAYSAAVRAPGFSAFGASAASNLTPSSECLLRLTSVLPANCHPIAPLCIRVPSVVKRESDARARTGPRDVPSTPCHFRVPKLPAEARTRASHGTEG